MYALNRCFSLGLNDIYLLLSLVHAGQATIGRANGVAMYAVMPQAQVPLYDYICIHFLKTRMLKRLSLPASSDLVHAEVPVRSPLLRPCRHLPGLPHENNKRCEHS